MTRVVGDGDPLPEPVGPPTGPEDCLRLELPSGKGETRADLTRRQLFLYGYPMARSSPLERCNCTRGSRGFRRHHVLHGSA